jgi:hypothetical protein
MRKNSSDLINGFKQMAYFLKLKKIFDLMLRFFKKREKSSVKFYTLVPNFDIFLRWAKIVGVIPVFYSFKAVAKAHSQPLVKHCLRSLLFTKNIRKVPFFIRRFKFIETDPIWKIRFFISKYLQQKIFSTHLQIIY